VNSYFFFIFFFFPWPTYRVVEKLTDLLPLAQGSRSLFFFYIEIIFSPLGNVVTDHSPSPPPIFAPLEAHLLSPQHSDGTSFVIWFDIFFEHSGSFFFILCNVF